MLLKLLVLTLLPFVHHSGKLGELHIDGYHEVSDEFRSFFSSYFTSLIEQINFEDLIQKDTHNYIAIIRYSRKSRFVTFFLDLDSDDLKFKTPNEDSQVLDLLGEQLTDVIPFDPKDEIRVFEKVISKKRTNDLKVKLGDLKGKKSNQDEDSMSEDNETIANLTPMRLTKSVPMKKVKQDVLPKYLEIFSLNECGKDVIDLMSNGDKINENLSILVKSKLEPESTPCVIPLIYTPASANFPFAFIHKIKPEFKAYQFCPKEDILQIISQMNFIASQKTIAEARQKKTLKWKPASDPITQYLKTHLKLEGMELVDLPLLQPWGNVYFACPVKLADSDDKMLLFLEFKIPDQTMYVLDGAEEEDLVEVAASFKPQPLVPLDDEENVKIEELNSGNTIFLGLVYTFYIGTQKRLQEFIDQIGLQKWELMDLNKVLEVNALIQSENQDSFAAFGMARKDGLEYILFMNDYRRKLEYMCVHVNNETQALSFSKKNSLKIETLFDRHVSAVMDDVIINYSAAHEMRLI